MRCLSRAMAIASMAGLIRIRAEAISLTNKATSLISEGQTAPALYGPRVRPLVVTTYGKGVALMHDCPSVALADPKIFHG